MTSANRRPFSSAIRQNINRLEQEGLIEVARGDWRWAHQIKLTDTGRTFATSLAAARAAFVEAEIKRLGGSPWSIEEGTG